MMAALNVDEIKIKCSDGVDRTIPDLINFIESFNNNELYSYNNISYQVTAIRDSHFCGYVFITDDLPYEGHGGITYKDNVKQGFDCCHNGDIFCLAVQHLFYKNEKNATFKMPDFIHQECKKIIDEYLNFKNMKI